MAHENQQFRRAFDEDDKPAPIYRPEQNQYPAVVAHADHGKRVVNSKEEHDALNEKHDGGWDFPGHEAPETKKTAPASDSVDELEQRVTEHDDRIAQLEAMVADLISKKKPAKDKPADDTK